MLYEIDWHDFPMTIQKDIELLMSRNQVSSGLTFGPFGVDINRETFKIVRFSNRILFYVLEKAEISIYCFHTISDLEQNLLLRNVFDKFFQILIELFIPNDGLEGRAEKSSPKKEVMAPKEKRHRMEPKLFDFTCSTKF